MDFYQSPTESIDQRIQSAANEFCNILIEIDKTGDEGDAIVMELSYNTFLNLLVKGDRIQNLDKWNKLFVSKMSNTHPLKLYLILCMAAGYKSCDNYSMGMAIEDFSFKGDGSVGLKFLEDEVSLLKELSLYDQARIEAAKADLQLYSGQFVDAACSFKKASELVLETFGKESSEYLKFRMYEEIPPAYQGDFNAALSIAEETNKALNAFEKSYTNLGHKVKGTDYSEYAALLTRLSIYCNRIGSANDEMKYAEDALNAAYENYASEIYLTNRYSFDGMPANGPDVYLERSLFNIKFNCAENLYKTGRLEESKTVFKELLNDYRLEMNNTSNYSALDVQLMQKKMEPLISLAPLCVSRFLGDPDIEQLAYNCALQYKNFSLMTENLLLKLIKLENDEETSDIYKKILLLKQQLDTSSKEGGQAINDSIKTLNELLMLNLDFSTYGNILNVDWHEIQDKMSPEAAAIEFLVVKDNQGDAEYFANILKKNAAPKCVKLCAEKELTSIVSAYTTSQAFKLIWQPLISSLDGIEEIYFSPTGVFHKIAIEYLPDENAQLVNSKYKIHRLSSTRELAINKNIQDFKRAVIYGGIDYNSPTPTQTGDNLIDEDIINNDQLRDGMAYLPQTLIEMANIEKTLSPNIKVDTISGSKASEASFKQLSGQDIQIMHLSTHGFYVPKFRRSTFTKVTLNPFNSLDEQSLSRSGLLMAGANNAVKLKQISGEDGILTAKEIARLDLSGVELVTLSACETALGDLSGEGVFGLQRGFKKAGVKAIIMSLWRVDDTATEILMTTFYDLLSKGQPINDALTDSQHQLMAYENGKYSDPRYWAAFIVIDAL
jgi:CHAT domain-containing protein